MNDSGVKSCGAGGPFGLATRDSRRASVRARDAVTRGLSRRQSTRPLEPLVASRKSLVRKRPSATRGLRFGRLATALLLGSSLLCSAQQNDAPELTEAADFAIERGLKYLLASQKKDGSWAGENGEIAVGATSLGLMAFMVRGHFPGFGPHGQALDRAKDFLLEKAKESKSGYLGGMYEHGLFTLGLSELWGMTKDTSDNAAIKEALQKAVDVILRSQSPVGGWRYAPRPDAGNDTSVTAMVFVSLASARQAGILVPTATIDNVVNYLRDVAYSEQKGGFGYCGSGYTVPCTAGGTYAAQLCGMRDTEWVRAAVRSLENNAGIFAGKGLGAYYYTHYYAIQAMVQAGDEHYGRWYPKIRDALIGRQNTDGSWAGGSHGYPHVTPMAIIILGTPYRYIPVYQR